MKIVIEAKGLSFIEVSKAEDISLRFEQPWVADGEEDAEAPVFIPISLHFNMVHGTRGMLVPKLIGVWLKGYGWLRGGCVGGEIVVRGELPFPKDLGEIILTNNSLWHGILPTG